MSTKATGVSPQSFLREKVKGLGARDTKESEKDHHAGASLFVPLSSLPEIRPAVPGSGKRPEFPEVCAPSKKTGRLSKLCAPSLTGTPNEKILALEPTSQAIAQWPQLTPHGVIFALGNLAP